mgnify:CR=1 FL=1
MRRDIASDISFHSPLKPWKTDLMEGMLFQERRYQRRSIKQNLLTLDELLDIYWDGELNLLNHDEANGQNRVHYQLWRNTVFAESCSRVTPSMGTSNLSL